MGAVGIVSEPKQPVIDGEPIAPLSMEVLLSVGIADRKSLLCSKVPFLTRSDNQKAPFSLSRVSFHTKTLH